MLHPRTRVSTFEMASGLFSYRDGERENDTTLLLQYGDGPEEWCWTWVL